MSALLKQMKEDNPVRLFLMDEPSGTVMKDYSTNATNGTYVNSPTLGGVGYLPGKKAAEFTTGTDHATATINLTAYSAVTVCFWLYKAAFANDDQLAMEFSANAGSNRGFLINPNEGAGNFGLTLGDGSTFFYALFTRPSTGWHFITAQYDYAAAVSSQAKLWIDAVPQTAGSTGAGDVAGSHANTTLYLASRAGTSLQSAQKMSHLGVYGAALSQDRITSQYRAAMREGVVY